MGRHFVVFSKTLNKSRFYTTCNALRPDFLTAHKMALERKRSADSINEEITEDQIDTTRFKNTTTLTFTVKNYTMPKGLSNLLHTSDSSNSFFIRGPLGCGLKLHAASSGTHVAFTAGTGALVFLDLVAYLLRKAVA